jgi:hypothetical protein
MLLLAELLSKKKEGKRLHSGRCLDSSGQRD